MEDLSQDFGEDSLHFCVSSFFFFLFSSGNKKCQRKFYEPLFFTTSHRYNDIFFFFFFFLNRDNDHDVSNRSSRTYAARTFRRPIKKIDRIDHARSISRRSQYNRNKFLNYHPVFEIGRIYYICTFRS